jgi:hypothetical protein
MSSKKVSKPAKSSKSNKKILGPKGPTDKEKKQLFAFQKDVAALAVAHGLAATTKGVSCRWEPRIRNGKIVYVWVCG